MTPRVHKPRPQPPGPAPEFEGCGRFVTHSPDFTPHRLGDVGSGSAAGARRPFGPRTLSWENRTAQTRSLRFQERQDRPARIAHRLRREKASEAEALGSCPAPCPRKFPVSVPVLLASSPQFPFL
ncbi:unnamed protein product [Pipistrellus nathusii]|uniref:Uncharacterized protein n=1 Tax=Pipistrellus nathusii TaxID=59473 RepID=A0ABN9ZMV0_PIPNA